jgi:uncharacterized RDD family membrane protein YckC
MRFDEVELRPVPTPETIEPSLPPVELVPATAATHGASHFHRLLALLTDLSLFVALTLALSPLLPASTNPAAAAALGGFVLMTSYYYFVGSWLLWGKTIGGAIFDVRVVPASDTPMSFNAATIRWAGICLSVLTAGVGFLFSLPDRLAGTRCVAAS